MSSFSMCGRFLRSPIASLRKPKGRRRAKAAKFLRRTAAFRRSRSQCLQHLVESLAEILQTGSGNDDGVPPSIHIFSNAQKPAARIFLQSKDKRFPFNL